ncbi:hypothetical protein KI387_018032, partial [Taxus chinensis]
MKLQMRNSTAQAAWFNLQNSSKIWDCESTLYDSSELRSFSFRLNRALTVVSRSSPACTSPLQAKSGGCFRSFSTRRNAELNYELSSSNLVDSKRKSVASWSLRNWLE